MSLQSRCSWYSGTRRFPPRLGHRLMRGIGLVSFLAVPTLLAIPTPAAAGSPAGYRGLLHGSYEVAWAVAVDAAGNTYVAGYTDSPGFPAVHAAQPDYGGGDYDAFVLKLDGDGTLVYSTYLGGSDEDRAYGIAVDPGGFAYVTGYTHSADFPTASPWQAQLGGQKDAFVVKLDPAGGRIAWSTFLGGSDRDQGRGIAVDARGAVFVAGSTDSLDFPVAHALQPRLADGRDAFVAKLNPDGRGLAYSTFLGGAGYELAYGIAVDPAGRALLTGYTDSADWPLADALQPVPGGGIDAFVATLTPGGDRLVFSTFLGGGSDDRGWGIATDATGGAYVTGYTESANFPTARPAQAASGGGRDTFASRLSPDGGHLVYSTFLGGGATDHAYSIAVDAQGNAALTGYTRSADFPIRPGHAAAGPQAEDGFVAWLDRQGRRLPAGALLGGGANDRSYALALDRAGAVHLAGYTYSRDLPVVRAAQSGYGGGRDVLVAVQARGAAGWRQSSYVAGRGSGPGAAGQAAIERGEVRPAELEHQGAVLFHTPFRSVPGFAAHLPSARAAGGRIFNRIGGPESQTCVGCHNQLVGVDGLVRLVSGGAGDGATNAFVGSPDPSRVAGVASVAAGTGPGGERNPKAVFGSAVKAQLAQEMTAELRSQAAAARAQARAARKPIPAILTAKGVPFGRIVARPDGSIDASGRAGIDADLVVKPFGARGTVTDLRSVVVGAAAAHLGVGERRFGDSGGLLASDLSPGDITALVYWVASRPAPRRSPPIGRDAAAQIGRGEQLLGELGCAQCHIPTLPLADPVIRIADPTSPARGVTYDLRQTDLEASDGTAIGVALYSDLRRHAMGDGLADAATQVGVGGDIFLTTPLWGAGSTGPWLHDGRAATLADAILWHGGEAQAARDRFARLPEEDREAVIADLEHLVIDAGSAAGAEE